MKVVRICGNCTGRIDARYMIQHGEATLLLVDGVIQNITGDLIFRLAGGSTPTGGRFIGPDGYMWVYVSTPTAGELYCKRTQERT